jgi:hypothetical protein
MFFSCAASRRTPEHTRKQVKHSVNWMEHFSVGGDETCLLPSSGEVRIVGAKKCKKHEKTCWTHELRLPMYLTGSAGSPQIQQPLMSENKMARIHWCFWWNRIPLGSTIAMTLTAFMTEEALGRNHAKDGSGIWSMPIMENFSGFALRFEWLWSRTRSLFA